nr:hypothetical protein [Tanacetum cinerariifolium]
RAAEVGGRQARFLRSRPRGRFAAIHQRAVQLQRQPDRFDLHKGPEHYGRLAGGRRDERGRWAVPLLFRAESV